MQIKPDSLRTEESYVNWTKRSIIYHRKKHTIEIDEIEIGQYIAYLAKNENVSVSI